MKKKYSWYDIWICVFRKVERRIKKRRSRLLFALLFLPDGGALCWFFVGDVHLLHFLEDCFSFVVLHFILQLDQVSAKPFLFSASLEHHQKCNFTKEMSLFSTVKVFPEWFHEETFYKLRMELCSMITGIVCFQWRKQWRKPFLHCFLHEWRKQWRKPFLHRFLHSWRKQWRKILKQCFLHWKHTIPVIIEQSSILNL